MRLRRVLLASLCTLVLACGPKDDPIETPPPDNPCFPEVVEQGTSYLGAGHVVKTMKTANGDCDYVVFYAPEEDVAVAGTVCPGWLYSGELGYDMAASDSDRSPDGGVQFSIFRFAYSSKERMLPALIDEHGLTPDLIGAIEYARGVPPPMEYSLAINHLDCR